MTLTTGTPRSSSNHSTQLEPVTLSDARPAQQKAIVDKSYFAADALEAFDNLETHSFHYFVNKRIQSVNLLVNN